MSTSMILSIETIIAGLTLQWTDDKRIFIFTIWDASRNNADVWINSLKSILKT